MKIQTDYLNGWNSEYDDHPPHKWQYYPNSGQRKNGPGKTAKEINGIPDRSNKIKYWSRFKQHESVSVFVDPKLKEFYVYVELDGCQNVDMIHTNKNRAVTRAETIVDKNIITKDDFNETTQEESQNPKPENIRTYGLPPRKISHNELDTIQTNCDKIIHTISKTTYISQESKEIECIMIVTESTVAALGLSAKNGWEILEKQPRPDGAFKGVAVTNTDYEYTAVSKVQEAMDEFSHDTT